MEVSKVKYEYKDRIVFKQYFGVISVMDIAETWLTAIKQNLLPGNSIGFILDYRNARFDIEPGGHIEIPKFYQQHPDIFYGKRVAVLTVRPEDVVYPLLVQVYDKGYESMPFSTVEAAIRWVKDSVF
ncbi:hypothetical protein SLH46_17980 [Draconibacterium sp. IB214405]|uniref:hypothetical protein n=1 Tax=Draconibacterium sp. IB214405 TaxID=3097352 RepID=UPI002A0AE1BC|nr:hypothetical protein [Draconibacterium sp. IB214405]MDX8341093.1 hypothetical protein [Draconibacterium sp. IB214405]